METASRKWLQIQSAKDFNQLHFFHNSLNETLIDLLHIEMFQNFISCHSLVYC